MQSADLGPSARVVTLEAEARQVEVIPSFSRKCTAVVDMN